MGCRPLIPRRQAELLREATLTTVEHGGALCTQGDVLSWVHVLVTGQALCYRRDGPLEEDYQRYVEHRPEAIGTLPPAYLLGRVTDVLRPGEALGLGGQGNTLSAEHTVIAQNGGEPACFLSIRRDVLLKKRSEEVEDVVGKVRFLRRVHAFSAWPRSQLFRFALCLHQVAVRRSVLLQAEGSDRRGLYIVMSGRLREAQGVSIGGRQVSLDVGLVSPYVRSLCHCGGAVLSMTQHPRPTGDHRRAAVDAGGPHRAEPG